jgi:hypothetical protein
MIDVIEKILLGKLKRLHVKCDVKCDVRKFSFIVVNLSVQLRPRVTGSIYVKKVNKCARKMRSFSR